MGRLAPRRGEMFIGRVRRVNPPPFGGAELNLISTYPVTFRPSERRTVFCSALGYKHFTPTEWRTCLIGRPSIPLVAAKAALWNLCNLGSGVRREGIKNNGGGF